MKKKTALLTACMMLTFAIAGCGAAKEEAAAEPTATTEETNEAAVTEPEKTEEAPAEAVEEKEEEKAEAKAPEIVKICSIKETEYEDIGYCKNNLIIVKKDGKFGMADLDMNEILPCKYDGYSSPSSTGHFVMRYDDEPAELYSSDGELIYTAKYADERLFTTGNWYIVDDWSTSKYYDFSGNLIIETSMQDEAPTACVAAYDGITLLRRYTISDDKGLVEVGKLMEDGTITWKTEYDGPLTIMSETSSDPDANGASAGVYSPQTLLSGLVDGYYVTYNPWIEWGYMTLCDSDSNEVSEFNICSYNNKGEYDETRYLEENNVYGFYLDGGYQYNRGTKMVISSEGKYMLFDAKDKKVLAIYDHISPSPEDAWLVNDGDKWGYIDLNGNELAMFDDAADFSGGYSLVVKDGEVHIIDTDMNTYATGVKAKNVSQDGDVYKVITEEGDDIYRIAAPDTP